MIAAKVNVDLCCDKCNYRFDGWNEDFTVVNDAIDDYILQAQEAGWECFSGEHVCPDCIRERDEEDVQETED